MIFEEKYFSHYIINWQNLITGLPLPLEILGNICIVIICCPVGDVTIYEIRIGFLIKRFSYTIKNSEPKFKYLKNKKTFNMK